LHSLEAVGYGTAQQQSYKLWLSIARQVTDSFTKKPLD